MANGFQIRFRESTFTTPRNMESLLRDKLAPFFPNVATLEVRLHHSAVGKQIRQGKVVVVRGVDESSRGIFVRAQPGSNDTCFEVRISVPREMGDLQKLYEKMKSGLDRDDEAVRGRPLHDEATLRKNLESFKAAMAKHREELARLDKEADERTRRRSVITQQIEQLRQEISSLDQADKTAASQRVGVEAASESLGRNIRETQEHLAEIEAHNHAIERLAEQMLALGVDIDNPEDIQRLRSHIRK